MQNKKLYIVGIILLIIASIYTYKYIVKENYASLLGWDNDNLRKGNYTFLMEGDKDNVYDRLLYIESVSRYEKFDSLLIYLLSSNNNDMLTQEVAVNYISIKERKEFLDDLISLRERLNKINQDSIWFTKINQIPVRSNKLKNSVLLSDLNSTITKYE